MGYGKYSYEDYEEVVKLWRRGLSKYTISKLTGIPPSTIYNWVTGRSKPPRSRWNPPEKPDPIFTYILGVLLGDATVTTGGKYKYKIKIEVVDYEFASKFSLYMSKILNKKYVHPRLNKDGLYEVEYYSVAFYRWFKGRTLKDLSMYIELDTECVKNFLMGIFDSDGHNDKNMTIELYNTNLELLEYVRYLLQKYFNIYSEKPKITIKKGTIVQAPKRIEGSKTRGKQLVKARKDLWVVRLNSKNTTKFLREIGFSIFRKQHGLRYFPE